MNAMRWIALGALLALLPVTLAGHGGGPCGEESEVDRVIRLVHMAYRGASDADTTIIMAELALFDLGKKGRIGDVPDRLTRLLDKLEDPALRNFTRMLIAASHDAKNDPRRGADALEALILENAPKADGRAIELPPPPHHPEIPPPCTLPVVPPMSGEAPPPPAEPR